MKIAVTYKDGEIFQHFGHCEEFKMYEVEEGNIKSSEVVSAVGSGHGALAGFLKEHGVQTLICGGIGGGARMALAEENIELYPGAAGDADASVEALLKGVLAYNPDECAAIITARDTTAETTAAEKTNTGVQGTTKTEKSSWK